MSGLSTKVRKRINSIRALGWNEPVPDSEPRRYRNASGYVRLRWLVGPQQYVEDYEHRINAGRPHPRMHVHHGNGVKDDNRPENLQVVTPEEHGQIHAVLAHDRDPELGRRFGGYRSAEAQAKAERRTARESSIKARGKEMGALYAQGLSTVEIGARLGLHPSNVSRHLRAAGVLVGRKAEADTERARARRSVHARSGMRCERCGRDLKWEGGDVHHRVTIGAGGSSLMETHALHSLVHLCRECHSWVGEHVELAYATGWAIRRSNMHPPSTIALVDLAGRSFRLDDNGGITYTSFGLLPADPTEHVTPF